VKKILKYTDYINEKAINSPAFSIHDYNVGDTVEVEGKKVKIVEYLTWIKDRKASCMSFRGELENGGEVMVKYDDGVDGYIFVNNEEDPYKKLNLLNI
jgi:myo-inositol-1-phosphate synthase